MLFRLPFNLIFRQHMMISAHSKTDGTVCVICNLRIRNRIKIQVDYIIERSDNRADNISNIRRIMNRKFSKRQGRQITYDKLSRLHPIDNYRIPVFRLNLRIDRGDRRHILCNLGT